MKISIIGIGYVGIHSVINLSKDDKVKEIVAYDINAKKIELYNSGIDVTTEVGDEEIGAALQNNVLFSSNHEDIKNSDIYIIAVPTDASGDGQIFLEPLIAASEVVGKTLKEDSIIIYESTVYPGLTEEVCIPLIKKGTSFNFDVVYTPERVDPGNKINTVKNTPRIIAGTSNEAVDVVINLYSSYIINMVKVSNIKTAESVKILENTQRDINIALMNNFTILMDQLNISTKEVLEAANTKWNFNYFTPGLVGGHCIGVDPYYLIHKMEMENIDSSFIKTARNCNEGIMSYIIGKINKVNPVDILYIGATFKPNTNDIRNSKHLELANELNNRYDVTIYDPLVEKYAQLPTQDFDLIIVGIMHDEWNYASIFEKASQIYNLTNKNIDNATWTLI